MSFFRDLKIAVRSLWHVRALWITVALTLALGIGANAAIFSVVRAVLLRPLANRDEDRLLYLRQSAQGIGVENATFHAMLAAAHFAAGQLVRLSGDVLDVPLFWQRWRLDSPRLTTLTDAVREAAGRHLRRG